MPQHIDSNTIHLIDLIAADLKRSPAFVEFEQSDIHTDLLIHLLEIQDQFDPARGGWPSFVRIRLRDHAKDMYRRQTRAKVTAFRNRVSMDDVVAKDMDNAPVYRAEVIADRRAEPADEVSRRLDTHDFLENMPETLRWAAMRLMDAPQTTVAEEMGMTLSVFRHQVLRKLREYMGKMNAPSM